MLVLVLVIIILFGFGLWFMFLIFFHFIFFKDRLLNPVRISYPYSMLELTNDKVFWMLIGYENQIDSCYSSTWLRLRMLPSYGLLSYELYLSYHLIIHISQKLENIHFHDFYSCHFLSGSPPIMYYKNTSVSTPTL